MPATHKSISEALFAVQQALPHVGKDNVADTGKYKYQYADLNAVQDALFPLFGEHGLVWTAGPGWFEGHFGLAYKLIHVASDTFVDGHYHLPTSAPQEIGSALTYARRYALCAVTGLAPGGDDDDGAKASKPAESAPVTTPVDAVLAAEWIAELNGAESLTALQTAWDGAGKAGVTRDPKVIAAKDLRKKALA